MFLGEKKFSYNIQFLASNIVVNQEPKDNRLKGNAELDRASKAAERLEIQNLELRVDIEECKLSASNQRRNGNKRTLWVLGSRGFHLSNRLKKNKGVAI